MDSFRGETSMRLVMCHDLTTVSMPRTLACLGRHVYGAELDRTSRSGCECRRSVPHFSAGRNLPIGIHSIINCINTPNISGNALVSNSYCFIDNIVLSANFVCASRTEAQLSFEATLPPPGSSGCKASGATARWQSFVLQVTSSSTT